MHSIANLKNNWLGKRVDTDGVPKDGPFQCVDPVKLYLHDDFGIPYGAYGDAINYWNHTAGAILVKFDRIATTDIQEGDIVVIKPNHIGIATGVQDAATFQMLAQNGGSGNGDGSGQNAIRIQVIRKSSIAGVLRPKAAAAPPAPVVPPAPAQHPYRVDPISPKQVVAKINATEWNLDNTTWDGFKTNPVSTLAPSNPITVTAIATHNLGGRYYMKDANQPHGFNVVDMADYVAIAPPAPQPAPQPVVQPEPAKPANTTYTKLESPLNLVVNKSPTHVWALDFASYSEVRSVTELAQGAPFVAYGKAQRTDLDRPCYYMTEADFGNADATGSPAANVGINTVDLSPAPAVAAAPEPIIEQKQPEPTPLSTADLIPVKVLPSANPDGWKTSFKTNSAGEYVASTSTKVYDVSNPEAPEQQLQAGLVVNVAGTFVGPNGIKYYRTQRSVDNGLWYGIPQICLAADSLTEDATTLLNEDFITQAREELGKLSIHERIIRLIAALQVRLFHKK